MKEKGTGFGQRQIVKLFCIFMRNAGKDFLQHLRGIFALAIWDKPNERLILARDRLGIKPLYYHFNNGKLAFASEIKGAFRSSLGVLHGNVKVNKLNRMSKLMYSKNAINFSITFCQIKNFSECISLLIHGKANALLY